VTVFAPIFITFLVRFVSGVPLLEKKYLSNPEFQAYCQQTNVFVPWFVKYE
jgi:steroid 5-alpha reductase family enzyme